MNAGRPAGPHSTPIRTNTARRPVHRLGNRERPRTIDKHRYNLDRHLLPRFEQRKLADITPTDVARVVADMQRAGFSGWTSHGALTTLSGVMRKAKRDGLIAANPVAELERDERPRTETGEARVLDEGEIAALLGEATTFRTLVAIGVFAGPRIGESLGLVWGDFDFDRGFVCVRYQLDRNRQRVPLKTAESRRDVVLAPQPPASSASTGSRLGTRLPTTTSSPHPTGAAATTGARRAGSSGPSSERSSATRSRATRFVTRPPRC